MTNLDPPSFEIFGPLALIWIHACYQLWYSRDSEGSGASSSNNNSNSRVSLQDLYLKQQFHKYRYIFATIVGLIAQKPYSKPCKHTLLPLRTLPVRSSRLTETWNPSGT